MSSGGPAHWRCYAYVLPAQGSSRSSRNTSGSKKRPNTTRLCNHIVCELHVCFLVQTTCDPMPTVGSPRPGGAIYPNSSVIRKRDGRRHGKRDINVAIGRVYIIALSSHARSDREDLHTTQQKPYAAATDAICQESGARLKFMVYQYIRSSMHTNRDLPLTISESTYVTRHAI